MQTKEGPWRYWQKYPYTRLSCFNVKTNCFILKNLICFVLMLSLILSLMLSTILSSMMSLMHSITWCYLSQPQLQCQLSTQSNLISTKVGFDMIMTFHNHNQTQCVVVVNLSFISTLIYHYTTTGPIKRISRSSSRKESRTTLRTIVRSILGTTLRTTSRITLRKSLRKTLRATRHRIQRR